MAKKRRYKLLDVVRRWYMALGLLACLIGALAAGLMLYNSGGETFAILLGCVYFVGAMVTGISLAAIGEGIELAMDLEDHARQTSENTRLLRTQLVNIEASSADIRESSKQCQAWLARIGKGNRGPDE